MKIFLPWVPVGMSSFSRLELALSIEIVFPFEIENGSSTILKLSSPQTEAPSLPDSEPFSLICPPDGESIPYDYLVIATGHSDYVPKTRSERIEQYQADYNKIESVDSILIIGGGPSGVELAGELAVDFPGKKVTLVHSRQRLLDFVGPKASKKAYDWLTSRKVEVILGQSI